MAKKIVVIGAGFAGMMSALAAQRLIRKTQQEREPTEDIEVTIIAPDEKLVLRPRLYEENSGNMSAPLGDLFKVTGIRFVQGSVETIDVETQQVASVDAAGTRSTLPYDRLVLAAGSDVVLPSAVPGLSQHSFAVDHLHSAIRLEEHLKRLPSVPATTSGRNTLVVCGGGYTGLEVAAELPGRLANIPGLSKDNMRVIVIERADIIGPDLSASVRPFILQTLERLGVEVKLGTAVTSIDAGGITTSAGEHIGTLTPIWTAGTVTAPLTQQVPGVKDQSGRLMVDTDLRCPESKAIFAAGDTACARTDESDDDDAVSSTTQHQYSKMSCQHALPMGRYAGHNAAADLLGLPTLRYSQVMLGTVLDLGQGGAIFAAGCGDENDVIALSGVEAKPLKRWINETLIYPPRADDIARALEAGNPVNRTVVPAGLGC
ncbi:uncharacterized protein PG998_014386 [Apiospora kogelbergensis]|uniref:uncharacterized protein n=1 Tax=Apiospora kogelbergensis TaxID=1337665 RepID=UPI0031304F85